ncbi:hypothetical protein JCM10213_002315 [Rhodosporidiobolus nylandii]
MLDRLPLELVDHVVRLALPLPFSFRQYRDRQDVLLALCRTSRALRAIAQPLLFEAVELRTADEVEVFVQAVEAAKLGGRVKRIGIFSQEVLNQDDFGEERFARLAAICPDVVESTVFADFHFVLPFLVELCLSYVDLQANVLHQPNYPSLRALHIQLAVYTDVTQPSLAPFFPQLDTLVLDAVDYAEYLGTQQLVKAGGPILLDYTLAGLLSQVQAEDPLLTDARPYDVALDRLRATCAARNIEVIDEPPFHPYYDSLVSSEFWRRCKAIKEEEELLSVGLTFLIALSSLAEAASSPSS